MKSHSGAENLSRTDMLTMNSRISSLCRASTSSVR